MNKSTSNSKILTYASPLVFGDSIYALGGALNRTPNGWLDDVQLYNEVLGTADLTTLYQNPGSIIGGGTTGDANGDGVLDAADYVLIKRAILNGSSPGAIGNGGDLDGSGAVDWADLDLLAGAMNGAGGGTVPEPATLFVMMAGGLPALLKRRRSRS